MCPERQALMNAADVYGPHVDNEPIEFETRDANFTARQEHTNRIGNQARNHNFYTPSRPIRAYNSRLNRYSRFHRYHDNDHPPREYSGRQEDNYHRRAFDSYSSDRGPSPDALRNRAEAVFVSAMADLDVREEREDRRDGDRYRGGGNNKRRRDGELATEIITA